VDLSIIKRRLPTKQVDRPGDTTIAFNGHVERLTEPERKQELMIRESRLHLVSSAGAEDATLLQNVSPPGGTQEALSRLRWGSRDPALIRVDRSGWR